MVEVVFTYYIGKIAWQSFFNMGPTLAHILAMMVAGFQC